MVDPHAQAFQRSQEGKDIVERLRACRQAGAIETLYMLDLMEEAAKDIEFLRKQAGAVTRGESMSDLKRRQGSLPVSES